MKTDTDMEEDQPETSGRMFTAEDIPKIVKLFKEADADGGGGLDVEEFCVAIEKLYGNLSEEEIIALHMQIDINCDGTVDLDELLIFLFNKGKTMKSMDCVSQTFPKPFKKIPVECHKPIVRMVFHPYKNDTKHREGPEPSQVRPYQKGQYRSISSDGMLTFWTDTFDCKYTIDLCKNKNTLPYSHKRKIHVSDMVYILELQQMAVSTSDRELIFYDCDEFPRTFSASHALMVEDSNVNTMNYWSNGIKAVFSFGDTAGFLYVFISNDIEENGLFSKRAFEKMPLQKYHTAYVSALLKDPSKDFKCLKIPIFDDICSQIRYFPELDSFAICGNSSKTMVHITLRKTAGGSTDTKVSKEIFNSTRDEQFFSCVDYSSSMKYLVTGGTDGSLRLWVPYRTVHCKETLPGHAKPITHIEFNPKDNIFVTLSEDKNVRVWSEDGWQCRQSFYIEHMGQDPISSMCYNIHNNELVVANSNIAKCLGRGTDVSKAMLTSHDKPLCSALYHSIFKQVVSVCQNGVVTVWEVLTGKAVMQFKVTPDQQMGLTAISFDGPKRRLITISQDGKVKLWNFNNGTELEVLPVTVPTEVTGIVCIDSRVFVSGRSSKVIFDLNLDSQDNKFLEHAYLDDISAMDMHEDTLVTASSNGNIIIWDVTTAEALYWINASKSPQTNIAGNKGRAGSLQVEKNQTGVQTSGGRSLNGNSTALTKVHVGSLLICLKTRQVRPDTATLLTSADGHIYAWSSKSKGGLLGKFSGVCDEGAVIISMSTDANEQILLTGDSTGKINLWDLRKFGIKRQADEGPFENISGWHVSLCPPPLLRSWQAHPTGLVSVQCDPACKNIITAGLDCNVRLWTNTGHCIGLFGRDIWDDEKVETRNCEILFSVSQMPAPLQTVNDNLLKRGATTTPKTVPTPTHDQGAMDIKPQHEEDKNSTQQGSKNTSRPCPSSSTATTGHTKATKGSSHMMPPASHTSKQKYFTPRSDTGKLTESSLHMQQSAGAVKLLSQHTSNHAHSPPILDNAQLRRTQSQFKPHPPKTSLIRGGTDLQQSSPQTASPSLNRTKCKYGRVLKIQQGQTLQCGFLTPRPPVILSGKRGSDKSRYAHLPSIPDKVQLPHQTQFQPHPPLPPVPTGRSNCPKSSPRFSATRRRVPEDHSNN